MYFFKDSAIKQKQHSEDLRMLSHKSLRKLSTAFVQILQGDRQTDRQTVPPPPHTHTHTNAWLHICSCNLSSNCQPNPALTLHMTPASSKLRSYLHICPLCVNQLQHYFSEFLCIWELTARSEQSLWLAAGYTPSRTGLPSFYWWPAESCYLFCCLEQKCQISVILLHLLILCRLSYWFIIDVYHAYMF
jgi:hypothetical protein